MPIKTQLRINQMTGSYGSTIGLINDQGLAVATGSAAAADMGDILSQMASAIKRINGADSFSEQNAGIFTHAVSRFSGDLRVDGNDIQASDGVATLTMSGRDLSVAGELTITGNALSGSGGLVMTMDGSNNAAFEANVEVGGDIVADADEAKNIFASVTSNDITLGGGGDIVLGGDLKMAAAGRIEDAGGHARFTATDAGATVLGAADGTAGLTLAADNSAVTIAGDLTVSGDDIIFGNGATIVNTDANTLTVTEAQVTLSGDLTVEGNDLDFAAANAAIGASVGANTLSLGGAGSTVAALNHLRVDGNILADANENKEIFSAVTSANIQIGNGASVIIPGDLTVQGTTTSVDTVNLLVKDPVVALAAGSTSINSNGGIAIISGSNNLGSAASKADMVLGRVGTNTWGAGVMDTQSGSITSMTSMGLANMRVRHLELSGSTDYLKLDTNLAVVAAADIVLEAGGGNVKPHANDAAALGEAASGQWSDLFLADAAVIDFDNGNSTLTGGSSLLSSNVPVRATKLEVDSANDYLDVNVDFLMVANNDVRLNPGGNDVQLRGQDANDFLSFQRAAVDTHYMNFAADASSAAPGVAAAGFGFRNNAGTMQFKNDGGNWTNFGSSTNETAAKASKELASPINADNDVFGAGNGLDISSFTGDEDSGRVDLFVNGQLMLSGGTVGSITKDYVLNVARGRGDVDVQINFNLVPDDVVTLAVK